MELSRIDAHTLILAVRIGSTSARDTLITYYCAELVPGLAAMWTRISDDAIAIGNLAVVEAIDTAIGAYDESAPTGIAAYLKTAITHALSHASHAHQTIPTPRRPERTPKTRVTLNALTEPIAPDTPESLAIAADTRNRLRDILYTVLSARDAHMMHALYVEDMTASAVAIAFNCSVGLVDKVRRNSLRALRTDSRFVALISPSMLQK